MDAEDCLVVTVDEALREALVAARMTQDESRLELAVALYHRGEALLWQGRELAGISAWTFQEILGLRGIPVHYDLPEYEADVATLRQRGRL
jgi:predicted HTH domain antitoxin